MQHLRKERICLIVLTLALIYVVGISLLYPGMAPFSSEYYCPNSSASAISYEGKVRGDVAQVRPGREVTLALVVCGSKAVANAPLLIKSVLMSGIHHKLIALNVYMLVDDDEKNRHDLFEKVEELRNAVKGVSFNFKIQNLTFPPGSAVLATHPMPHVYCYSQRLFMSSALPDVDEILYLDADTLVVGDVQEIWSNFDKMSSYQIMGAIQEHQSKEHAWYGFHSGAPFYPPYGVNSGVLLMNLTRLREYRWENLLLEEYFPTYMNQSELLDQDLINIAFHFHPEALYLLHCSNNYRTDLCKFGLNCKFTDSFGDRIKMQVLHGNKDGFKDRSTPIFVKIYELISKYDMAKGDYTRDVINPFKDFVSSLSNDSTKKSKYCNQIGDYFF